MRRFWLSFLLGISSLCALAQGEDLGVGLGAGLEYKLAKGLKLNAEAEVRTQDNMQAMERWALDLGLSYRWLKHLKSEVGYCLMDRYHLSGTTGKGNLLNGYWTPRHRLYAGLAEQQEWGRWKVSLRERYQFTATPKRNVPKFVGVHGCPDETYCVTDHYGERLSDEIKGGDSDHLLRQRLQVQYNIRHCKFDPFASVEMINDLGHSFSIDQMRYTLGIDYTLSKHAVWSLQCRYKDRADSDESNGWLLTLGYNYTF